VHADGSAEPGKAIVVLKITDPGFQDFRSDASCIIRPQSLLGEKFVNCEPTKPRAPGTPTPPPLEQIPDGQPGAGQYLLPVENNGNAVDLDLVQNINREPFIQRFRLILNDLGIGLAARGKDLNDVIRRADPGLRELDDVLSILRDQNHQLANLARDSDTVLAPLARERRHLSGFIAGAGATAQATAERGQDLQTDLQRLPPFLRELRLTMNQLKTFSDQGTPLASDLNVAAPTITRATKALGPFARGGRIALTSLGRAAAKSGQPIANSDPVIKQIRDLARSGAPMTAKLAKLLANLRSSGGFDRLMDVIFNTSGSVNAFDKYGHFLRTQLLVTSCVVYQTFPIAGCGSNWRHTGGSQKNLTVSQVKKLASSAAGGSSGATQPSPGAPVDANGDVTAGAGSLPGTAGNGKASIQSARRTRRAASTLFDYAIGPSATSQAGDRHHRHGKRGHASNDRSGGASTTGSGR
jgi:phospholipid/cholesterol/gamma-HCH transport system substrate-binding protein